MEKVIALMGTPMKTSRLKYRHGERTVSVLLEDNLSNGVKKKFRCTECGFILFEYTGRQHLIFEGKIFTENATIDVLCKSCKTIYRLL